MVCFGVDEVGRKVMMRALGNASGRRDARLSHACYHAIDKAREDENTHRTIDVLVLRCL